MIVNNLLRDTRAQVLPLTAVLMGIFAVALMFIAQLGSKAVKIAEIDGVIANPAQFLETQSLQGILKGHIDARIQKDGK